MNRFVGCRLPTTRAVWGRRLVRARGTLSYREFPGPLIVIARFADQGYLNLDSAEGPERFERGQSWSAAFDPLRSKDLLQSGQPVESRFRELGHPKAAGGDLTQRTIVGRPHHGRRLDCRLGCY